MSKEKGKTKSPVEPEESSGKEDKDTVEDSQSKIEKLEEKIVDLTAECKDKEDNYLRVLADMNNQHKRQEREKSLIREYALESFLKSLLPVLDSLNKALLEVTEEQEGDSLVEGFSLVSKQLKGVLEKSGLEELDSKGEKFNPNFHQAIQKKESEEVKEDIVEQEFVKGYTLNGRLLRAAMVSVVTPKA